MRALLLVLALFLALACSRGDAGAPKAAVQAGPVAGVEAAPGSIHVPPESARARQIAVQAVQTRGVVVNEVVAPGRVAVDPQRSAKLLLPVPGRIVTVAVRLGDTVTADQPVVAVESPEADGALAAERHSAATERQAESALAKARTELDRLRDLYGHGAVAQKEVVAGQTEVAQAEAALEAARAERGLAFWRLELLGLTPRTGSRHVQVRAPVAGKVVEINAVAGEYRSDLAAPLMTIADLRRVWVSSDVAETRVQHVRVGDPVTIALVAYPGEIFTGRVARIADVIDRETRTLKVHVELPNPGGRLRPDMFASVRHAGRSQTLPIVPAEAVVRQYGRSFVFRERRPGEFERREVTVGPAVGPAVAVLEGLAPGDRVVAAGAVLLAAE
jgi:cobalt-zinc-cadmium efflux system membrane fusion protein